MNWAISWMLDGSSNDKWRAALAIAQLTRFMLVHAKPAPMAAKLPARGVAAIYSSIVLSPNKMIFAARLNHLPNYRFPLSKMVQRLFSTTGAINHAKPKQ